MSHKNVPLAYSYKLSVKIKADYLTCHVAFIFQSLRLGKTQQYYRDNRNDSTMCDQALTNISEKNPFDKKGSQGSLVI